MIPIDSGIEAALSAGPQGATPGLCGMNTQAIALAAPKTGEGRTTTKAPVCFQDHLRRASDAVAGDGKSARILTPGAESGTDATATSDTDGGEGAEVDRICLWPLLMQWLQEFDPDAPDPMSRNEARFGWAEDAMRQEGIPESGSRFYQLRQQIQKLLEDLTAADVPGAAQGAGRLGKFAAVQSAVQTDDLLRAIQQLIPGLREPADRAAGEQGSNGTAASDPGQASPAPARSQGREGQELTTLKPAVTAEAGENGKAICPAQPNKPPAPKDMLNAGDASPDPARGVVAERLELKAGAGLVDPSHSGPKKTPSEMPQLQGPLPDGGEGVGDVQEDQAADPGDSRAPAQDSPSSKDGAAAENGAEARSASTNRFEMALRETRPELLAENKPEQGSNVAAEAKTREGSAGALRSSVFDQIVQRAIVQVKNASGEIRIDLKPDFLGQVRMEIVTENQQVTVRILTERPVVRDMIETNLHQLKSELQSQGLQVQRVEVAVSNDPREQPYRQAKQGGTRKRVDAVDAAAASDRPSPVKPGEAPYYRSRAGLQATVDTFV